MAFSLDQFVSDAAIKIATQVEFSSEMAFAVKVDYTTDNVIFIARSSVSNLVAVSKMLRKDIEDNRDLDEAPVKIARNLAALIDASVVQPRKKQDERQHLRPAFAQNLSP